MVSALVLAALLQASPDAICTMQAPPLEVKRIRRDIGVRSTIFVPAEDALSILLKDGNFLRVQTSGCVHAGGNVMFWTADSTSVEDAAHWLKEAVRVTSLAFGPYVGGDLESAIDSDNVSLQRHSDGLFVSIASHDEISFDIQVMSASPGVILRVGYAYP